MANADRILNAIEHQGWRTERISQGWRAYHPDQSGENLFLCFTPSWVSLQVPLDLAAGDDPVALYRQLLLRCESMFMAKYCRDHKGTITLQVDIPITSGLIEVALDAIARYRDQVLGNEAVAAVDRTSKERYFEELPGIPAEVIAYYLRAVEAYGWGMLSKQKGITWLLGYKGQRTFHAYMTITKAWTYFHIPILPDVPAALMQAGESIQRTFYEYLLGVNGTLYMAKLGINEAGQVVLMLETPTQELDFDLFRFITRLLAAYLDLYAREIQLMAHLSADQRLMNYLNVV
jgi:hypothetical protein